MCEPVYDHRFASRDSRLLSRSPIPAVSQQDVPKPPPHALVLLTPRAQPTVVWPMHVDEAPIFHPQNVQQVYVPQQPFFRPPPLFIEPDPLANHRRFPSPPAAPELLPCQLMPQPMFFPCEEFTPRNYSHSRKHLWKPRPNKREFTPRDLQPRVIMSRRSHVHLCPEHQSASTQSSNSSLPSLNSTNSSTPVNSTISSCLDSPVSSNCITPSTPSQPVITTSVPNIHPITAKEIASTTPKPPPSAPELTQVTACITTPGALPQRRRKKQTKIETTPQKQLFPTRNSWTTVSWKSSRWLLSHEKSVVRLLLCLLMIGVFALALVMESKGSEVVVEAENWSKPKYDWINNLE